MAMNPRLLRPRASDRLLLDDFSGARAAFSLRKLQAGHTTAVVRVRRSNDNAEADFTADEVSSGALASWVGSGNDGRVRTWYDQTGNSRHAEQATSTSQPLLVESGSLVTAFAGRPALKFVEPASGNGEFLRMPGAIAGLSRLDSYGAIDTTDSNFVLFTGVPGNTPFFGVGQTSSGSAAQADAGSPVYYANGLAVTATRGGVQAGFTNKVVFAVLEANTTNAGWSNTNASFCGWGAGFAFAGFAAELVFWDFDTSGIRSGIEKNINRYLKVF